MFNVKHYCVNKGFVVVVNHKGVFDRLHNLMKGIVSTCAKW